MTVIEGLATILMLKNENRFIYGEAEFPPPYTMLKQQLDFLKFSERVYILDDHSTDGSVDIYNQYPNVKVIPKPFEEFDENKSLNLLLNTARENKGNQWVLSIDGDEILEEPSIALMKDFTLEYKTNNIPITVRFNYINLWRSRKFYRTDKWYNNESGKLFRLTPDLHSVGSPYDNHHFCYGDPINGKMNHGKLFRWNKKILHYAWVNWKNVIAKCKRCIQLEIMFNNMNPQTAREKYEELLLDEKGLKLAECYADWNKEFRT